MIARIHKHLPALGVDTYRSYFYAKGISDVGSWMQRVAQGYMVYLITESAFWVGAIDALQSIPSLIFVLFGGALIDSHSRTKILQYTQLAQFALSIITGIAIFTGTHSLTLFAIFAVLSGTANAIDHPARLSLAPLLVPKELVRSATSLNMTVFNMARIVGPMIAGIVMGITSPGMAYILNGLSFLPFYRFFKTVSIEEDIPTEKKRPLDAIKEGILYVRHHKTLAQYVTLLCIFSLFGVTYITLMPVFADEVLGIGSSGLGTLYAATGIGSVLGGVWYSAQNKHTDPKKVATAGAVLFCLSTIAIGFVPFYPLALVLLFFTGIGQIVQNATIQSHIQLDAEDALRGRVSSIQSLVTQGTRSIGSFTMGALASAIGISLTLSVCAVMIAGSALWVFRDRK
jgi:MFS family permease